MTETIFMIHGMWGRAWLWENYRRLFEKEGYHCVATTLRYHAKVPLIRPDVCRARSPETPLMTLQPIIGRGIERRKILRDDQDRCDFLNR